MKKQDTIKMTKEQTNLLNLSIELEMRTKEYSALLKEVENCKQKNLNPNSREYKILYEELLKNQSEIAEIKEKLARLGKK